MTKRELRRELQAMNIDGKDKIKVDYELSEDRKKVTLTFTSPAVITSVNFVHALCNWANDFTELLYNARNENDETLS